MFSFDYGKNIESMAKDLEFIASKQQNDDYVNTGEMNADLDDSLEFKKEFGANIEAQIPQKQKPYLEFDKSCVDTHQKLNNMISQNFKQELLSKSTLTSDIEKQFQLPSFRISKRQKKKINSEKSKETLKQWFDMPRVTEITKDQEKDLVALKMRRTWDPKQFYKRNSQNIAENGKESQYFQIGTVTESHADFYNGRLTNKQRKKSIIDELMDDAKLRAYNKRKIGYAMNSNSRLRIVMKRKQMAKEKQKIKMRRAPKVNLSGPPEPVRRNVFKTTEI